MSGAKSLRFQIRAIPNGGRTDNVGENLHYSDQESLITGLFPVGGGDGVLPAE